MNKLLTLLMLMLPFTVSGQTYTFDWYFILPSNNSQNPEYNESWSTYSPITSSFWVSHLEQYRETYNQKNLGTQKIYFVDKFGNYSDTLTFSGKAHIRYLKEVNNELVIWIGFRDSVKIGNTWHTNNNSYETAVCYLDPLGNLNDMGTFADTISALAANADGNIVMISNGPGNTTSFHEMLKFNNQLLVTKELNGLGEAKRITQTSTQDYVITGSCMDSLVADNVNVTGVPANNSYLLLMDVGYKAQWLKYISNGSSCFDVFGWSDGVNTIMGGRTDMAPTFDALSYDGPNNSGIDFYLSNIQTQLFNWVQEVPSDTGDFLAIPSTANPFDLDGSNDIYIIGRQEGPPVHWQLNATTSTQDSSSDAWVASYTQSGVLKWVFTIGSKAYDQGTSISVKGTDEFLITAPVGDTISINNHPVPAGSGSTLVMKISGVSPVGTMEYMSDKNFSLYPNPGNGIIQHDFKDPMAIEVYSYIGKQVAVLTAEPGQPLDLSGLNTGVYFIKAGNAVVKYIITN